MYSHSSEYKGITLQGDPVAVTVRGGRIAEVRKIGSEPGLSYLLPPLVDLQHNGGFGIAYNEVNSPDQLWRIGDHLIRNGVGRVLATFTTTPYDLLEKTAVSLNRFLTEDRELAALFCGIFHEGVFISPRAGWRGGHDPAYIMAPDWARFRRLNELSGHRIRMVNVAPEEPGAMEFISAAVNHEIKVALGHCCPDTATIDEAVRRGASMVTHFANGAASQIHRFANPFWGFLDNDGLALGMVGDGFHLPPEVVRVALKQKGYDKCFMVSDANMHAGCKPGRYRRLGGVDCIIEPSGFIHLPDEQLLAGAWFQNNRSVEFLVNKVGLDFVQAWKLCSLAPASLAGIELPQLRTGDEATFVQARFENDHLKIEQSVFLGREYLTAGDYAITHERVKICSL